MSVAAIRLAQKTPIGDRNGDGARGVLHTTGKSGNSLNE
jgi:hypothetical protein